jgi:hypothetical protein
MSKFTVVYQFLCSNCKFVNSGKRVIEAGDAMKASQTLATGEVPCRNCHKATTNQSLAKTIVFQPTEEELGESSTGPAVPRT